MQLSTEKITIRLTPDQVEALDTIVLNQDYKNRSESLRIAIENYIEEQVIDTKGEKVVVEIPRMIMMRLDSLIDEGFTQSRQESIREAIKDYILETEREYIKGYNELKEMKTELAQDYNLREVNKEIKKR